MREFQLCPGLMVIALPNQIIEQRYFSHDFKGIFFAVSKNLLETLPKIGNVLSLFFYLKDYPCFDLTPHEQEVVKEYHAFIRKRLRNKEALYRREVVMGLMQGFFFELCTIFTNHAPANATTMRNKSRKEYIFERFYESEYTGDCRPAEFCKPIFLREIFQALHRYVSKRIPEKPLKS